MNKTLDLKFKIKLDDNKKLSGFLRLSEKELKRLTQEVEKFGRESKNYFSKADKGVGKFSKSLNGLGANFKTFAGAALIAAPALAGLKFKRMVDDVTAAGDALQKMSIRIGASTEALSQYQLVADLSGVSFNTLTMGFQRMTRRVSEAANGTGEAVKALDELGLSAKLLEKLAPERQFEIIAEKISQLKNQSDKIRVSMKLFDTEGVALLQTMEKGAAGIKEMREEADRLGITLSRSAADDMAKANDEMTKLRTAFDGIALSLTISVIPSMTKFLEALNRIGKTDAKQAINELGLEILDLQKMLRDYDRDVDKQGAKRFLGFDPEKARDEVAALIKERAKLLTESNKPLDSSLNDADGRTGKPTGGSNKKSLDFAKQQAKLAENAIQRLQREIALREDSSAKTAIQYDITFGSLKSISALEKERLLILAGEKDAIKLAADEYAEYNAIVEQGLALAKKQRDDESAARTSLREQFKPDDVALERGINDVSTALDLGVINESQAKAEFDKLGKAYNESFVKQAEDGLDGLIDLTDQAARNMQGQFADFLFDPFDDGLSGMLEGLLNTMRQMAAELAAQQIFKLVAGAAGGAGGAAGGILSALFAHDGAVVGGSSGTQRNVNPLVFAGAQRFHDGGFPGLKSDEVPAILQTGERVLSRKEVAWGAGNASSQYNITVNVTSREGDSASQTGQKAAEAMARAIARQEIKNAARPGNQLNPSTKFV